MVKRSIRFIPLFKIFDGSEVSIPMISYGDSGKRVLIVTPLHGNEVTPIYLIWRVMEYIESSDALKGSLDIVLGVNFYGLLFNMRVDPLSGRDINRSFPGGDEYGSSGHIAKSIYELAHKGYDLVLDIHGAGYSIPHIIIDYLDLEVTDYLIEVAKYSGIPYIWDYYDMEKYYGFGLDRTLTGSLVKLGVPSLTYELPTSGYSDKDMVNSFNGLINILSYLDVLDCDKLDVEDYPKEVNGLFRRRLYSEHGGFIEAFKEPGEYFIQYEDLAVIKNILGEVLERIRVDKEGYIISIRRTGVVKPYEGVTSIATVR
ncbi:TPA: hypothetical protein EYP83_04295 [Candidatus Geothermarchaeota archaeon]|nr:hypothetical protein [Candidatus Geothermarchaeota archaeon]HIQ13291.1 hypothetical protein [Thermoprotei archaeon]